MLIYLKLNYYLNIKLRNIKLKYYYDNLRNKAYAFYIDKNNIMFNFQSTKKLNLFFFYNNKKT
jgi:hypothetical protein